MLMTFRESHYTADSLSSELAAWATYWGWEGVIVFGICGRAWKEIQRRAGRVLIEADRRGVARQDHKTGTRHEAIPKEGLRVFCERG